MDVQRPEIPAKLLLLLNANVLEVLVSKDDDTTLGNEKRKLVLLQVVELRQLETTDLGANDRCQLGHLEVRAVLGEKVRLLLLGHESPVVEFEWLESRETRRLVVNGKISRILVLRPSQHRHRVRDEAQGVLPVRGFACHTQASA